MKKNILLQLLFLLSFSLTCIAQADRPKPTFKVKIASPRKDCDGGLNICATVDYNFRQVNAGITTKENQIQFHLERSTMHETLENELLHLHQFHIEEETQLPMDITNKIGMTREVTIIPGRYPIEISDDYISITCAIE
jgi:hypothetical protein